jgi:hypothetical protein
MAGFDDGQIAENIAHVALTVYVNVALDVPLNFPGVKFSQSA